MNFRPGDERHINGNRVVFRCRHGRNNLQWWDTVDKRVIFTTLSPRFDRQPRRLRQDCELTDEQRQVVHLARLNGLTRKQTESML